MNLKNKLIISTIFFTGFLMCLHPIVSFAATHYVSTTGSATWEQSLNIGTPCSATTALSNAVAGDLVYFRGGEYDPGNAPDWNTPSWNPTNSGSDGSPITFEAYPGETPVVLANSVGPSFGSNGKNYIIWDGFEGPGKLGLQLYVRFYEADHCTIQNCKIKGYDQGAGNTNNPCISAHTVSYLTIKNCELYGNEGGGHNSANILIYVASYLTVENNTIYDAYTGIFDKDGGQHNTYRYNFIHDTTDGFLLGTEFSGSNPTDINIYQNIFLNNSANGIIISGDKGKTNVKIYNNVIYNSNGTGINTWPGNINGIDIYNNIMYSVNRNILKYTTVTNFTSDYSGFYNLNEFREESTSYYTLANWFNGTGYDEHSTDSNPNFVNAGGTSPNDYKLQPNSPCIGTGQSGKNMGAWADGDDGTIIGYVPGGFTTKPSPPENLKVTQ